MMKKRKVHSDTTCLRLTIPELELVIEGLWEYADYMERTRIYNDYDEYTSAEVQQAQRVVDRSNKLMRKVKAEITSRRKS
tara:strand:- start:3291 stop:3530 length:240 start_codon:yes stop_codon:yes gene_type:complete